jgi:ribosomal protein S18 acetylase RimI-like enzyme
MFLVAECSGRLIGSCMAGYEGHRGWINYLAVHPDFQRQGLAARLMAEAETILAGLGCPKINLQIRKSNHSVRAFYESIGFVEDEVLSMGRRLITDTKP